MPAALSATMWYGAIRGLRAAHATAGIHRAARMRGHVTIQRACAAEAARAACLYFGSDIAGHAGLQDALCGISGRAAAARLDAGTQRADRDAVCRRRRSCNTKVC